MLQALAALRAGQERAYYDRAADAKAREHYYASLAGERPDDQLRSALTALLQRTHTSQPRYEPAQLVYPWVDLRPDRQLRSIYSGKAFPPERFIEGTSRSSRGAPHACSSSFAAAAP